MSWIMITLRCSECGIISDPVHGSAIDTYTYHDAPSDGLQYERPANWAVNLDPWGDGPGFVLCPEHRYFEERLLKASADAWRKRVNGGVR